MSKLIISYSIFSVLLFGALFAAFFISGLGAPSEPWQPAPTPEELAAAAAPPPDPFAKDLDHPNLEPGRTYRVSHPTKLYREPDPATPEKDPLPAQGYFLVGGPVDTDFNRWYLVTVDNGFEDVTRYILAKDLNFKRVVPQYSDDERRNQERQALIDQLHRFAEAQGAEARANRPPPEPEVREPETFNEWWAMTAHRMGGAQPATIVVSAGAAAVGTLLTIGAMFMVTALRREHTWDRAPGRDLDAEWEEAKRGEEDEDFEDPEPDSTDPRW